jgi:glycosidase
VEKFPPLAVYNHEISPAEYLEGESSIQTGSQTVVGPVPNREVVLEEMLMLWLANANPAFSPFMELFEDDELERETAYPGIIQQLKAFFDLQPAFGPQSQNLVDMLRSPAIAEPHSLPGQMEYIRQHWASLLGQHLYRLLTSLDLIQEEEKAIFFGPGPARVMDFTGLDLEPERFSQDKDWMPSHVLIAKNAYVWLDQISKRTGRHVQRLDQIPDDELDRLSHYGFSGLWLIGLWERSPASQRIKQLRGNPEAVASAYSLFEYQIAADLGGEQAYQALRERAWQRGIRLASDMVPNHMGIDSRWLIEHPDWFIQLSYSPFPSYSYSGPNLSWDERVSIFIEDHYFDNTDAAVVFKRVDNWSGEERYIYHGNDGTSMPWNDTAQLNYLIPEVREAVIQTILTVARKFQVIRFDAAMTLAKKHYQRLWYPEPGSGGAIPSRSEHGLTKEDFDAAMPVEFWREVVDRVAQEAPDTLLLAEAFWLMEGYFVRTLGMHRVYNSAFMNMLRDEKNAEYRLVIKNTLEFDPEILKRYVNFMNNPDERTAVDQFGRGDKYFGVCLMMATMPGLPMFGHGQIEGFSEKYGMEYRRAYWDETPDPYLVERHEREIFPLLRRRPLFADSNEFLLYDLFTSSGSVNEDVYAYSNRRGEEAAVVVYHNRYATAQGWIRTSAAYSVKDSSGERRLVQKSLGEGLGLSQEEDSFCIYREEISGLEYIVSTGSLFENGLYMELEAYKYKVFTNFRQVQDNEWRHYANLESYLNGRGVPSISDALKEIFLQPIHQPFSQLVNRGFYSWVMDHRVEETEEGGPALGPKKVLDEAEQKSLALLVEVERFIQGGGDVQAAAASVRRELEVVLQPQADEDFAPSSGGGSYQEALRFMKRQPGDDDLVWGTLLSWLFSHRMGQVNPIEDWQELNRSWIDEWILGKIIVRVLMDMGLDERRAWQSVSLVKILIGHQGWCSSVQTSKDSVYSLLKGWLGDSEIQQYLGVNRYQGILWYNKEAFENLLWWLFKAAAVQIAAEEEPSQGESDQTTIQPGQSRDKWERLVDCYKVIERLLKAQGASDFQVEKLFQALKSG